MSTNPRAHYLLFSEATAAGEEQGVWRFVLDGVGNQFRLSVSDVEAVACPERLELLAVVRGLEAIDQPSRVTLVTKSRYVSRGLRRGLAEWRANGWQWERFGRLAPVRDHDRQQLRCSFCQVALGEGIGLTTQGLEKQRHRTTSSSFCSTRCRDCVLALAELHPSPLASDEFIARRALLTDRLLDLWRHGQGPDPALVLEAARTASSGLVSADNA